MRKLYRSEKDKWIAGVLGGLGEYLDVDATILRIAYIVFTIASAGAGIIGYILAVIVIPKSPMGHQPPQEAKTEGGSTSMAETSSPSQSADRRSNAPMVVGIILVGLGVLFLFNNFIDIHWHLFWPAILIVIGLVLLGKALMGEKKS